MGNECKDYYTDLRAIFDKKTYDFNLLPTGWIKTFVPRLKDELFEVLGNRVDDWEVIEIKEKFGQLRIYHTWKWEDKSDEEWDILNELHDKLDEIINRYEDISVHTCTVCGKEATHMTTGYVLPICDTCKLY